MKRNKLALVQMILMGNFAGLSSKLLNSAALLAYISFLIYVTCCDAKLWALLLAVHLIGQFFKQDNALYSILTGVTPNCLQKSIFACITSLND